MSMQVNIQGDGQITYASLLPSDMVICKFGTVFIINIEIGMKILCNFIFIDEFGRFTLKKIEVSDNARVYLSVIDGGKAMILCRNNEIR